MALWPHVTTQFFSTLRAIIAVTLEANLSSYHTVASLTCKTKQHNFSFARTEKIRSSRNCHDWQIGICCRGVHSHFTMLTCFKTLRNTDKMQEQLSIYHGYFSLHLIIFKDANITQKCSLFSKQRVNSITEIPNTTSKILHANVPEQCKASWRLHSNNKNCFVGRQIGKMVKYHLNGNYAKTPCTGLTSTV